MYYGIDASDAIFDDATFDKANLYAMKFDNAKFARVLQGSVDRRYRQLVCGDDVQEGRLHQHRLRRREHLRHRSEDGADDRL